MSRGQARFLEFSFVGLLGITVQLGTLHALIVHCALTPLVATAAAIEVTLVHNFLWHERLTWRDRPSRGLKQRAVRLCAFHLANGAVSLAGNLGLTAFLLRCTDWPVVVANLVAICACSVVNFLLGDRWVFRKPEKNGVLDSPANPQRGCRQPVS